MKATGIVRRIDDLGRVVVPKEIRRTLRIREGDPLEIFTDREGEIILKKYSPIGELGAFAKEYAESLAQTAGHITCIVDKDQIIAVSGGGKKEFFEKQPYLNNKYGYEEIPPSLYVADAGMKNVFCPELLIIHKPLIDKWDKTKEENIRITIIDCATPYALKKMIYPNLFLPLLKIAYYIRCKMIFVRSSEFLFLFLNI